MRGTYRDQGSSQRRLTLVSPATSDYGDTAHNSEDGSKAEAIPLSLAACADHIRPMEALLKVRKIGKDAGIILPEEFLTHVGAQIGDSLEVETTTDCILLRALPRT